MYTYTYIYIMYTGVFLLYFDVLSYRKQMRLDLQSLPEFLKAVTPTDDPAEVWFKVDQNSFHVIEVN